jgi:RHS repeat-associated protein
VTNRLATVTFPNGQTSAYTYLDDQNDHRLQTIHHKYPNTSTLSKFDYTYDAVGNILTWRQQADTTAVIWKYGYDPADQLIGAVKHATDAQETVLKRYAYAYDSAGNRTVEQIDDAVTLSAHDNLNRLTSQAPGGPMVVAGTLNEPGTVTISGVPALVDANNTFRATVPTVTGANTFTIVARDPSGNTTTQTYEVNVAGTGKTFTYDANGNMTGDGARTLEWDARNRLVAVSTGAQRTEFGYSSDDQRALMRRLVSGVVQETRFFVNCDGVPCEERSVDGATVVRRRYPPGDSVGGVSYFASMDHLGSITAVSGSTGVVATRYSYGPWGQQTLEAGAPVATMGYAALEPYVAMLSFATHRVLDPALGRWLSEDPGGMLDGPNLYGYVSNKPIVLADPLGLQGIILKLLCPRCYSVPAKGVEEVLLQCDRSAGGTKLWHRQGYFATTDAYRAFQAKVHDECYGGEKPGTRRWVEPRHLQTPKNGNTVRALICCEKRCES